MNSDKSANMVAAMINSTTATNLLLYAAQQHGMCPCKYALAVVQLQPGPHDLSSLTSIDCLLSWWQVLATPTAL